MHQTPRTVTTESVHNRTTKRRRTSPSPRMNWSLELHSKFVGAILKLGPLKAFPSGILKEMNEPNLSRPQVASHLQKYRNDLLQLTQSSLVREEEEQTQSEDNKRIETRVKKEAKEERRTLAAKRPKQILKEEVPPNRWFDFSSYQQDLSNLQENQQSASPLTPPPFAPSSSFSVTSPSPVPPQAVLNYFNDPLPIPLPCQEATSCSLCTILPFHSFASFPGREQLPPRFLSQQNLFWAEEEEPRLQRFHYQDSSSLAWKSCINTCNCSPRSSRSSRSFQYQ